MKVLPFGESASYIDLGIDSSPDRSARTHAVAAAVRTELPDADVVVGAGTVVVVGGAPRDLDAIIRRAGVAEGQEGPPARLYTIDVVYDGPDLQALAKRLGLAPPELVALHEEREVAVELVGFLPGFAYLGPIDERLVVPRRPSPRPTVAAGSVALAGSFTGIYPFASPGGWNLIGSARRLSVFDPERQPPMLLAPGDRVRFRRSEARPGSWPSDVPRRRAAHRASRANEGVEILVAPACATIQDLGRAGQLALGIPPSGPLDPDTHADANLAVGNAPNAAAIEVPLGRLEIRALRRLLVSIDGALPVALPIGARFVVPPSAAAVRYLAIGGGIDVPLALGSRATLLVASIGGHEGRPLLAGDILAVGADVPHSPVPAPSRGVLPWPAVLEGLPGPHVERFPSEALDVLSASSWIVSRMGDRVGVRLEGARVPRDGSDLALPNPMVRGSVQVSTDGTPIVLGPDHPTTGGYPVIAVLRPGAQALLGRLRPGHPVRFAFVAR